MVSVKQAAESAVAFVVNVLGPERAEGIQLEEVELGKFNDRDVWNITLSMVRPSLAKVSSYLAQTSLSRDYKTFVVDRETGDVLSMKIRELAHAE